MDSSRLFLVERIALNTLEEIRSALLSAGVRSLREFGYPGVTEQNILTDRIYSQFFLRLLRDSSSPHGSEVHAVIEKLIQEINDKSMTNPIFVEYTPHEGRDCYKLRLPWPRYPDDATILCPVSDGLDRARFLALQILTKRFASALDGPTS